MVPMLSCWSQDKTHCAISDQHEVFLSLLKMSYGASYSVWHVDQILLGHPLMYRVWHPYKYSVENTYKALAPNLRFLEQGWDLKLATVLPLKVKLRRMEKTIVGLPGHCYQQGLVG